MWKTQNKKDPKLQNMRHLGSVKIIVDVIPPNGSGDVLQQFYFFLRNRFSKRDYPALIQDRKIQTRVEPEKMLSMVETTPQLPAEYPLLPFRLKLFPGKLLGLNILFYLPGIICFQYSLEPVIVFFQKMLFGNDPFPI